MVNLNFSGSTVITNLWNLANVPTPCSNSCGVGNNPPNVPQPPGTTYLRPYEPDSLPINWTSSVPSILTGLTVNEIIALNIPNFILTRTLTITISKGSQSPCDFSKPNINVTLFSGSTQLYNANLEMITDCGDCCEDQLYCSGAICPIYNQSLASTDIINSVQIIPWNRDVGAFLSDNYDASNLTLQIQMNITLSITCEGSTLESGFCLNYCTDPNNLQTCFNPYFQKCLVDTNSSGDLNIFSSQGCRTYFVDYLTNKGPNSQIDVALNVACGKITDILNEDANTQTICACHLNKTFYDNLRNDLEKDFPGSQLVAEIEECLFPLCVDSVYTTSKIGKICPIPRCVDIESINNNGTISGPVQINQSPQCTDLIQKGSANNGGTNGGSSTTDKTWIEKNWVWLVIGISILVVLIIVIIIFISAESNKKKKKK